MVITLVFWFQGLLLILPCLAAIKPKNNTNNRRVSLVPLEKVSYHKRLVADLLDYRDYNKDIRPVKNPKEGIDIYINQKLIQILDVNERGQYVALNLWTTTSWYDEFLAWNPAHYDNIESIIVPYDQVWRPDAIVDNSLKMNPKESERHSFLKLKMDVNVTHKKALVTYTYPAIYSFTCQMDISRFPFDTQNCSLFMSSWSYSASELRFISQTENGTEILKETEEWNIISFEVTTTEMQTSLGATSVVNVKLVIQRKSIYYIVNMVIPTILITFVALLGFFSPSSSNAKRKEKMMLGINTLLAMSVLQLAISDTMPITSNYVPLIGAFFVFIIILTSVATGTTTGVINIEKSGYYGHRVSDGVKKVVKSRAGRLLGSKAPPPEIIMKKISRTLTANLNVINDNLSNEFPQSSSMQYSTDREEAVVKTFTTLSTEMSKLQKYYNKRCDTEVSHLEWQWFSNMIDRVLFIAFMFLLLFITGWFFNFGIK